MSISNDFQLLSRTADEPDAYQNQRPADHCLHPQKLIDDSPQGYKLIRCASKNWGYCSYCANLYQKDQSIVIGNGCMRTFIDDEVDDYYFYAVTLSAPSFGKVHTGSTPEHLIKCVCGETHLGEDGLIGCPVNENLYRYSDQVLWNANVNDLLRYTIKYLGDKISGVEYVAAREWQRRGCLHIHMIIRIKKAPKLTEKKIMRELKRLKLYKYEDYSWGRSFYVEPIEESKMKYVVKYIIKSLGKTPRQQSSKYGIISNDLMSHYAKLDKHAKNTPCSKGPKCPLDECDRKNHQQFGWNGHLITKSAGWSLNNVTLTTLKQDRAEWLKENKDNLPSDYDDKLREMFLWNNQAVTLEENDEGIDEERAQRLFGAFGL